MERTGRMSLREELDVNTHRYRQLSLVVFLSTSLCLPATGLFAQTTGGDGQGTASGQDASSEARLLLMLNASNRALEKALKSLRVIVERVTGELDDYREDLRHFREEELVLRDHMKKADVEILRLQAATARLYRENAALSGHLKKQELR